jgi:hypothetical protein
MQIQIHGSEVGPEILHLTMQMLQIFGPHFEFKAVIVNTGTNQEAVPWTLSLLLVTYAGVFRGQTF